MPGTPLLSRAKISKRSSSPSRFGKPPSPSGIWANERSDSRIAKRPSCQKPWRGIVARKFGLPRPALSIDAFAGRDTAPPPAALMSSSFSSNGLSEAILDRSPASDAEPAFDFAIQHLQVGCAAKRENRYLEPER